MINLSVNRTNSLLDDYDCRFITAIFQVNSGKPVPECFHSGFYWI